MYEVKRIPKITGIIKSKVQSVHMNTPQKRYLTVYNKEKISQLSLMPTNISNLKAITSFYSFLGSSNEHFYIFC